MGHEKELAQVFKNGKTNELHMTGVVAVEDLTMEVIKTNASQFKIEQKATARVRFHLNERIKQARREFAAIQRECKDILKRLPT